MERDKFFRRKPVDFVIGSDVNFEAARCPNVNEFLYMPVIAEKWQQHQLWDGTYTLDDLLDINEVIMVEVENKRRSHEAGRKEQ